MDVTDLMSVISSIPAFSLKFEQSVRQLLSDNICVMDPFVQGFSVSHLVIIVDLGGIRSCSASYPHLYYLLMVCFVVHIFPFSHRFRPRRCQYFLILYLCLYAETTHSQHFIYHFKSLFRFFRKLIWICIPQIVFIVVSQRSSHKIPLASGLCSLWQSGLLGSSLRIGEVCVRVEQFQLIIL